MLAKTLWVLAAGQTFPFPGEQRAEVELDRLETWLSSVAPMHSMNSSSAALGRFPTTDQLWPNSASTCGHGFSW